MNLFDVLLVIFALYLLYKGAGLLTIIIFLVLGYFLIQMLVPQPQPIMIGAGCHNQTRY